jgi:hypothetical protein
LHYSPSLRGAVDVVFLPLLRGGEAGVDCITSKYVIPDLIVNLLFFVFLHVTFNSEKIVNPESSSG